MACSLCESGGRNAAVPREPYSSRFKVPLAASIVDGSSRVLDVGCGTGTVLIPLAQACGAITGVDTNKSAIDQLTADLHGRNNAAAQVGDAEHLPFPDNSFDAVLCYSTLCVVTRPTAAIAEIARVLRPGGRAVIDFHGSRNANSTFWRDYYEPLGINLKSFRFSDVQRLLHGSRFFIDAVHGCGLTRAAYYLPVLRAMPWLDRITHSGHDPDLDYALSNVPLLNRFAASWNFVVRRQ